MELLVGALEEAVLGEQLPLRLAGESDVHRGSLADTAQRHQPARQRFHDVLAVNAVADQQPRSRRRRERNRNLQLRIVPPAGALIGIGPAAVEDIFALRVRFQIAGHDAGDAAADLGHEVSRPPAGARSRRTRFLNRRQKRMGDEGVIGGF